MADPGAAVTLTPGFQTAFKLRAIPRAELTLEPEQTELNQLTTRLELTGSCKNLPTGLVCDVSFMIQQDASSREARTVCTLAVDGESASVTLDIDIVSLGLVGSGSLGILVTPRFPYCEPARIEPGRITFDNQAHVRVSRTTGCKIGTVVTVTPVTTGAFASGNLMVQLFESDADEAASGSAVEHELFWFDDDRAPQQWRIGCADVEGPPAFTYRQVGESGALEYGCRVAMLVPRQQADDEPQVLTVYEDPALITDVPFPRLESLAHEATLGWHTISGRISGFAPGLEVPLYLMGAMRAWSDDAPVSYHLVTTSLAEDGSFSKGFGFPLSGFHVGGVVGLACGAIHKDEPLAAVIDYDETRFTPLRTDILPPRAGAKDTAPAVGKGEIEAAEVVPAVSGADLNAKVIEVANSKSGGGYYWPDPAPEGYHGAPETFKWQGSTILGASEGRSHCCGFTCWVALEVAKANGLLEGKTVKQVRSFKGLWFGSSTNHEMPARALPALGIGVKVPFQDAQPGDFMQLWRTDDSGHSVIFLDWVRDAAGTITAVKYRGSNKTTKGVGDHTEKLKSAGGRVDPAKCHVGRMLAATTRRMPPPSGPVNFFIKDGDGKKYVEHAELANAAHKGTKVYAEVDGKAEDQPFAQITKYGSRYGMTTQYNGKDRPRTTPAAGQASRLKVSAAVSQNEGAFVDTQAYDNAYLTHGTAQWTQESKNLQKLLARYKAEQPQLFAQYFTDVGVDVDGTTLKVDGEALPISTTSLLVAYCCWRSGYVEKFQQIQLAALSDRIDKFYPGSIGAYFTSERSVAHLLDLNVNRPAYVKPVADKAIAAFKKKHPSKTDPAKWTDADELALVDMFLEIRHTYGKTPMTDSKDRAAKINGTAALSTKRKSFKS